ncbi:MAG: GTPase domain-containing protein [Promethearchaeota archaeon]
MAKKITLIGRAGVGKTSILKLLFEGSNSKDLLTNPLEPTRGITPKIYSWMDLELSIFDTSGQELPLLLEDENEQNVAFNNADFVIYILDFPVWIKNSKEIIKEINKIFNILKVRENNLVILFHKIDLINQKISDNFQLMKSEIKSRLNLPRTVRIYFTSLYPELDFTIFNSFFEILSSLSLFSNDLKSIIDQYIRDQSKLICFITNKENYIIVQSMTNDFNTDLIYKLYILISYYIKPLEINYDFSQNIHSIDSGNTRLRLIVGSLENANLVLKRLIIFSENKHKDNLFELKKKIKLQIENYCKNRMNNMPNINFK